MTSLIVEREGNVAVMRLNRPEVRNAIDDELQTRIIEVLTELGRDMDTRALVVTGTEPAFCAGGDVKAMRARLDDASQSPGVAGWRRLRETQRMISALHDMPKVTVAAVNGPAVGVGLDLALACDFVFAADSAFFATAFIERGLVPDGGGMYSLPRRIGLARAKELVFSGRRVSAGEALEIGLADRVVSPGELVPVAVAAAAEIGSRSPTAIALAKSILNRTYESSREDVLSRSADAQAICYTTEEHRDAVSEFLGTKRTDDTAD
jgi:enoyl-CoA hydratase/carnithine racemase